MVWDDIIEREKRGKIAKTGGQAVGLGVGAFLLQFFFKTEAGDTVVRDAFSMLGLILIVYGGALLAVFMFKPHILRFFYTVTTYVVVPIPVAIFVTDIVKAVMKQSP